MLKTASAQDWLDAVLGSFDEFLLDHAANERKASAMAMSMVAHYPDRPRLVTEMIDLALEEMNHFRQVYRLIEARGLMLTADDKDPYVNALRRRMDKTREPYLLDRLLTGSVIEARGAERFSLIADALEDDKLASFYTVLARSEAEHQSRFIEIANLYFHPNEVQERLEFWLEEEATVLAEIPIRPRLH